MMDTREEILIRRRGMMAEQFSYRILEYATFAGAYFHLQYYPIRTTQIDANIKNSNNANQFLWWAGGTVPRITCYITSGSPTQRFGAQSVTVTGTYFLGDNITLQQNKDHFVVGAHTYNYGSQADFTATDLLYFGAAGSDGNKYQGSFRWMQIREGGGLVFDLVPVERNDGVVGFLDQINNVFYPSETSTPFTAGPYL